MTTWVACPDCHAPAVIRETYTCDGSPNQIELARVDCTAGCWFNGVTTTSLHPL